MKKAALQGAAFPSRVQLNRFYAAGTVRAGMQGLGCGQ
jgi:hypothetical protein